MRLKGRIQHPTRVRSYAKRCDKQELDHGTRQRFAVRVNVAV